MGFLNQRKILITGVASERSIAWGVARAMHQAGAQLAFSFENERLGERVAKLAASIGCDFLLPCDVRDDASIQQLFDDIGSKWGKLDGFVHAIGFAPRNQVSGDFIDNIDREGFTIAHDISAYSLPAMLKAARAILSADAAVVALTYLGAVRSLPNYNTMGLAKASLEAAIRYSAASLGATGVRVNGISAGPVKTLAASGVANLRQMLDLVAKTSPLQQNVSTEEIGNVAAFLCSPLASGITGEIIYVDKGFHSVGMPAL